MTDDTRPDQRPVRGLLQPAGELRRLLRSGPGGLLHRPTVIAGLTGYDLRVRVRVEVGRLALWPSSAKRRMAYRFRRYARRVLHQPGLPDRGPLLQPVAVHQVRVSAHDLTTLGLGLGGLVLLAPGSLTFAAAKLCQGAAGSTAAPLQYRLAAIATTLAVLAIVGRASLGPTSGRIAPVAVATLAACGLFVAAAALEASVLLVITLASAAVALVPSLCLLVAMHAVAVGVGVWRERVMEPAEPNAVASDVILGLFDTLAGRGKA